MVESKNRRAVFFKLLPVFVLAFFLTAAGELRAEFDYSKYKEVDFEKIDKVIRNVAEEHKGSKGVDLFTSFYAAVIKLPGLPRPMDEAAGKRLKFWNTMVKDVSPDYVDLFTHTLELARGDIRYVLYFQKNLVPYFEKEVKPGDEIRIYCVLIMYNESTSTASLLINEFQTPDEAAGPQE